jgi:hypothetical protein
MLAAFAAAADAQNCANGNSIYHRKLATVEVSCSQESCHGNDPRSNKNGILDNGQQASGVQNALDTVADMSGLQSSLGLTSGDVADLALYIWYRAGNSQCPAAAPSVQAAPGSLAFGSVNVGTSSGTQAITVTNTGGAAATGMAYGAAPAGFSRTHSCPTSLAAGASCTITVTFSPTAAQAYGGNLTITGSGGTNLSVSLSGTGAAAAAPHVVAAPGSLAFGSVAAGASSASQTITVSNTGSTAASGMVYGAAPAGFSRTTSCPATLGAGASCTISVTFSPTAAQAYGGSIAITGSGGINVAVALSGTGSSGGTPPPTGQLSVVTSVPMPATTVGAASAPQSVTVSNIGGAAVTVSSITSSNAGEFAVSGSTCTSVPAGGGCTFNITFIPAATGARSGTVTVTSSGTGSPQTILVSGTGNPPGGGGGPTNTAVAVEYYHAAFDHYFVTTVQDEITKLDNGTFVGWARTGKQFKVYTSAGPGLSGVCRFFSTTFNPKSSHFYTADESECTVVKANKDWTFEAVVFYVPVPAMSGACPIGTMPVFRLYNNGQGAAPNHRFTVESAVREDMMAKPIPWIPEGYGIGVTMCSPP